MHAPAEARSVYSEPEKITTKVVPTLAHGVVFNLRLLWSSCRLLQSAAVSGLAIATVIAFVLPPTYESTAQLMPPDTNSPMDVLMATSLGARAGDMLSSLPADMPGLKSSGALFIGVLRSRTVQDRIVDRFNLRRVYGYKLGKEARIKLEENSSIFEDRKSGIVTIVVSDHDRQRAAAIAQAYVDELNHLVSQLSTSSAHRERVFLEQRIAEVKRDLDRASHQLSDFSSRNTAMDLAEQGRAMIEATSLLTGQLIAAESELSGLKQIYNPVNVRVRSTEARIAALRAKIAELRGNDSNASGDLPSLRKLPQIAVQYSDLYRESKTQEALYGSLTQQYELAKVQEAKEIPSVKLLDAPDIAERRSYPPRLQIMLAGIFLGFTSASAWILTKYHWEQLDEENPGKALVEELLAAANSHIPWASPNASRLRAVTRKLWLRLQSMRTQGIRSASTTNSPPQ